MNCWQVAAGEGARDYSATFLKYGVMLIGAGNPGPYFENEAYYSGHRDWRAQVVRFAKRVSIGDTVILKWPHHREWQIRAVGEVTGKYEYLEQFEDVKGWDQQHCRTVEWVCPPIIQNDPLKREVILTKGLSMGTFKRVNNKEAIKKAESLRGTGERQEAIEIPLPARTISDEDLVESLIDNGLRPSDSEGVIEAIWRVRRLARWYERHGRDLSEHETRTFLIMPIMLALGWSEQRIKIEWKNIDVAFFQEVYRRGNEPCMILESKRMREGLGYAEHQAEGYAKLYPKCSRLVVSDGIRYQFSEKDDTRWIPKAYMNLLKLKDRHPYEEDIEGAAHLFINLMPK